MKKYEIYSGISMIVSGVMMMIFGMTGISLLAMVSSALFAIAGVFKVAAIKKKETKYDIEGKNAKEA